MGILVTLVVGAVAGWLTGLLQRGQGYGLIGNIVVGIIGALVGGFLGGLLFSRDFITGFNLETIITAVLGAVIVTFVWGLITGRK